MVTHNRYFAFFLAISLALLLSCGAEEKEEYESKLKTRLEHHPPGTHIGTQPMRIPVFVKANYAIKDSAAQFFYRQKTDADSAEWRVVNLQPALEDTLIAILPPEEKGTTWNYYFQISPPTGEPVTLPRNAPEKTYQILFKGEAARWLKILHSFFSHLTLILMALSGFYAYRILSKSFPINFAIWFSFAGFISFLLGAICCGIWLKLQVYGVFWQGFPFGTDVTDLFVSLLLIYWVMCFAGAKDLLMRRPWPKFWYSDVTLAYLTVVGAICTIVIGIFAHHL